MVRAARVTHKNHEEQALQMVVDLLEATEDETLQIDGAGIRGMAFERSEMSRVCGNGADRSTGYISVACPMEDEPTDHHP